MVEKKKKETETKTDVAVAEKQKSTELAETQPSNAELAIPDDFTGLEEVQTVDDVSMAYLRLLQEPDQDIDDSQGGFLVDTIDDSFVDIRKDKGEPVEIIPLAVVKDYEAFRPLFDNAGRLHAKNFGDKIGTFKEHDELVQRAKQAGNREGTRRSYVVFDEEGNIECLVQQVNKVFVWYNDDFYCLSLRSSKIKFFKQWNKIMQRKNMPICRHYYLLSSVLENNPVVDANYWNYDIKYGGLADEQKVRTAAKMAMQFAAQFKKGQLNIVGTDED